MPASFSFFILASLPLRISSKEAMLLLYINYFVSDRARGSVISESFPFLFFHGRFAKWRMDRYFTGSNIRLLTANYGVNFFAFIAIFDYGQNRTYRHRFGFVAGNYDGVFENGFQFLNSVFNYSL